MTDMNPLVGEFEQALLQLDRVLAKQLLLEALASMDASEAAERMIVPALQQIGAAWQSGAASISQVYMSGRICEDLLAASASPETKRAQEHPWLAIAVLEDHHSLGSRMVCAALRASGFQVRDYGHGVTVDELARRVTSDGVQVLLVSVLMLPSALRVKELRRRLTELGASVRIVVGGAPFSFDEQLWREVGADAMGRSASDAVAIVASMAQQ